MKNVATGDNIELDFRMDAIGLIAGFFVILTFYSRQPKNLRIFALISNVFFIIYGGLAGIMPVLVLAAILLPLNAIRAMQLAEVKAWNTWKLLRTWRSPIGLLFVCMAAFFWATVGVASQMMTQEINPALTGLARTLIGCVFILAFTLTLDSPKTSKDERGLLPLLCFGVCCAMFQISLFTAFEVVGVTITVAVTVCLPPLIVQFLDAIWHRIPLSRNLLLSMAVAVVGVLLVLTKGPGTMLANTENEIYGGVMLLIASFSFAGVAISSRNMGAVLSTLPATGFGLGACAIVLMVACMALPKSSLESVYLISWTDVGILTYMGIGATGFAYMSFVVGMNLCRSAGVGMAATLTEPVAAAILGALVLGERLSGVQLLGCVTMLFAITFLLRNESIAKVPLQTEPASAG